jgi:ABC-type uncharacterized transport system permease subunit
MITLTTTKRPNPSVQHLVLFYFVLVAVSLAAIAVVLVLLGLNPLVGLRTYLFEPIATWSRISETLLKMSPLLLIAQGLAFGFRARVWNVGAEGQLLIGAIIGSLVPILLGSSLGVASIPAMMACAAAGGAIWAAIPAFLRTKFNASEVLVTLMLNAIALQILWYLVAGPLRDPLGFSWPQSAPFPSNTMFPIFIHGQRLNASIFVGLTATILAWLFLRYSFWAFRLNIAGLSPDTARYAGFSEKQAIWATLLIGGAAAGLAGLGEIAGPIGQLQRVISPGYGYSAIIIAFLGRLNPLGIFVAAFAFAVLTVGGELAQTSMGLPYFATSIIEGVIFVTFLGSQFFLENRIRINNI